MNDSDLNALLATKVMGWRKSEVQPLWLGKANNAEAYIDWNPCQDYNHLRQVEEALNDEQKLAYEADMCGLLQFGKASCLSVANVILRATARQRCEAIARVVGEAT